MFGWGRDDGAYYPVAWPLLGTTLLGGAAALLLTGNRAAHWVRTAAAMLAALGALSVASVAWGGLAGVAWKTLDQLLIAAAALLVGSMLGADRSRRFVLAGVWLGLTALAIEMLLRLQTGSAPADWFLGRKVQGPVGYHNAQAALFAIGIPLGLWGASAQRLVLRFAAGCSIVILESALLLTQSRGAIVAVVFAVVAQVVIAREIRLAALAVVGAAAGLVLLLPLRDVDASLVASAGGSADAFRRFVGWAALGALALGLASSGSPRSRVARRSLAGATLALLVVGVVGAAVMRPTLPERVTAAVRKATAVEQLSDLPAGDTRLGSLSLNGRARIWHVAVDTFLSEPLVGGGIGTFARVWGMERGGERGGDTFYVLQAHSVELDALSELGVIGALFLVAVAVFILLSLVRGRGPPLVRATGAGVFVALLAQASIDWTLSFPALVASALLVVGASAGSAKPRLPTTRVALAQGIGCLAVLALLAGPYFAAHTLEQAKDAYPADPDRAWRLASRAHGFDPWNSDILAFQGTVAEGSGDYRLAAGIYDRAAGLAQQPWVDEYRRARALRAAGLLRASNAACRTAQRQNPAEERLTKGACATDD